MRYRTLVVPIALAIIALSCTGDGISTPVAPTVSDSAGVRIVSNEAPRWASGTGWRLGSAPEVTIGSADGDAPDLLDRPVGATILGDGRIVVADMGSSELRFFDREGRYLSAFGSAGEGPGEFRQLVELHRSGPDRLLAVDRMERLYLFDAEGILLSTVRTGIRPLSTDPIDYHETPHASVRIVGARDDGTIIGRRLTELATVGMPPRIEEVQTLDVVLFPVEADDEPGEEIARLPGPTIHPHPMNIALGEVYGAGVLAAPTRNALIVVHTGTGEVRRYGANGALEAIVRAPWPARPVTEAMVEVYVERSVPPLREDLARDRTFAGMLPAFSKLLVDPAGNVWLRLYEVSHGATMLQYRKTFDDPSTWYVIDAEGTWLGEVAMPAGFTALEIGEDYVLGLSRDALDVEYIQRYRLER